MLDAGVIWQGFAPRNMFLQGNELLLIDFEEVVDTTANPARAAECLMWHQVFFADSLTIDEAYELFAMDARAPAIADGYLMPADPFERALLSVDSVTWRQRRELLSETIRIEGRHRRPENTRGDDIIYGHELGHFWGDFLPVAQETRIFAHLRPLESPITLAACLEVFEAAMEADICRAIRTDCSGVGDNSPLRTEALIDVMEAAGVDALSAARGAVDDWPVRVTTDPARLVDDLLIGLGTAVGGVDRPFLDTHLIGGADARQGHEDDLAETMRVGLDFLHGAEPEQPFLRHVEPSELRKSVARPLPVEGAAFKEVLAEVDDVIVRHSIGQGHHRYLAFPDSGNALAALAGNLLSPLLNQNLIAVDRSAPSATFVEIQVVEWLRELVGYESAPLTELRGVKDVSGLWTTGGHLSNHIAMLAALGQSFPAARKIGRAHV